MSQRKPWTPASAKPSERELQVLTMLSNGAKYSEIGLRLHVTVNTVKTHQRRVFARIGARDAHHAVRRGFELGLLVPNSPLPAPVELIPLELQVLDLVSFGLTDERIGARLGLTAQQAKYRAQVVCRELGATGRAHAVRKGFELGLLQPGGERG